MSKGAAALAGVLLLGGCGAGQTRVDDVFSEGNPARSMVALETHLRGRPVPDGLGVAVGVNEDGLVGVPLAGGSVWSFAHPIASRPEVVGSVVVGVGGEELFCLRATTGALLWTRPVGGLELIGAGDDGDLTAVALASASRRSSTLLVVSRDGHVLRQLETDKRMGRPATLRGVVFVPWMERHVTAYDVLLGQEVGRLSLRRGLSSAVLDEGALFFGDQALVRLDPQLALTPPDELPRAELPEMKPFGALRMLPRLPDARALAAGQPDRVRAYARPSPPGASLGLLDGIFYASYQRAVMAFRADAERPIWARLLDQAPVGGAAYRGGVALCDSAGVVTMLGQSSGNADASLSLGRAVLSCVVQGGDFGRADSGVQPPPLATQLAELLLAPDPELLPLQRPLLSTLGAVDDDATTHTLLTVAADPRVPPALLPELSALIASRRRGVGLLLAALEPLHDPRKPLPRPPLAAVAAALASLGERRAAPLLARHLGHPYTPSSVVRAAAQALVTLASADEAPELESFFALYRCTAEDDDMAAAVVLAARALLRLGPAGARQAVKDAAADPLTLPAIRSQLAALTAT